VTDLYFANPGRSIFCFPRPDELRDLLLALLVAVLDLVRDVLDDAADDLAAVLEASLDVFARLLGYLTALPHQHLPLALQPAHHLAPGVPSRVRGEEQCHRGPDRAGDKCHRDVPQLVHARPPSDSMAYGEADPHSAPVIFRIPA